ncbi:MAG: ATP-binding protein [Hassallia sp.]
MMFQTGKMRLPRSLSSLETWGFSMTTPLTWIGVAVPINAALGTKAMFVWLPCVIVGMLLNLQVKRMGMHFPEMSGGTPNYTTKLLKNYPGLGRYAAIGYFIGWASGPAMNAILLTDLIQANLKPLGIACPEMLLKIGFTVLPFIVAFSGTRALALLHMFLVIPAAAIALTYSIQGVGWLALSPNSPGLIPPNLAFDATSLNFGDWAKYYFIATYVVYGCESAAAFVADSRKPQKTLKFLSLTAWLMPILFLGSSWVLMQLATPALGEDAFLNLLTTAKPFWGQSASFLATLLIACGNLLGLATAVAICPRVLYQLALDGHMAPVFGVVSRRGVLTPGLIFTFLISLVFLCWGNVTQVVMVGGMGYFAAIIVFHLAVWLKRSRPEVLLPRWSFGFLVVELFIFIVGGFALGWQDWLIGISFPLTILAADAVIRRVSFAPMHPAWWIKRQRSLFDNELKKDVVVLQVSILLILISGGTAIGWLIRAKLDDAPIEASTNLLAILLMSIAFVGIAIASWTSLLQVASIVEARDEAEHLFKVALDTVLDAVLLLDENGIVRKANKAALQLLEMNTNDLQSLHLSNLLSDLPEKLENWSPRSEQILKRNSRILDVAISTRINQNIQEYIVILRDITQRKQAEAELRQALQIKKELAATATAQATQLKLALQDLQHTQAQLIQTEKMSSLGQLVAGVAHEINNPVNFIHGNLTHIDSYIQDLITLIKLYQDNYPQTTEEITNFITEIDLDFLMEDMPKTFASMKVGTERIREIVLTLRNFSRLDESDMKPVNIHEGIDSTLLILQSRLKAKSEHPPIEIIKEYGDLPEVECYAGQLNQVFMNILTNSIDALDDYNQIKKAEAKNNQSKIIIYTKLVNTDFVAISIKDNGGGMSESVRQKLFDPFFTTKPVGQGTGLGLSISYQIVVDKHKGKIECISQPGLGAQFCIEIPILQIK